MKPPVIFVLFLVYYLWVCPGEGACPTDYLLYGPKTVYDTVRWNGTGPINPECTPLHLWLLVRHGTRYTTVTNQAEILGKVKEDVLNNATHGTLCEEALAALATWNMRMDPADDMKLADVGWEELRGIGRRHKALYPALFPEYTSSKYNIQHTNYTGRADRTKDSARAYAQGAFGTYEGVDLIENGSPDWLLHFYRSCAKYRKEVGDEPVEEYSKFVEGPEMSNVFLEMSQTMGLRQDYFDPGLVYAIYEMCRFERGIFGESPWCALMSAENYRVLEFSEDILYYWREAYAHDINYEQACVPVVDVLENFRKAIDGNGIRSFIGSTHHPTMDSFFARLGMFKDSEHLTADGYVRQANRKWRTSLQNPMASNIAFVLKSCPSGNKVEAFVNEAPVLIPGCTEQLCAYDKVVELWQPIADGCDIEEICKVSDSETTGKAQALMYSIVILISGLVSSTILPA